MLWGATLVLCLALGVSGEYKSYDKDVVVKVLPTTDAQLQALHQLRSGNTVMDFWNDPAGINIPVLIRLPAKKASLLQKTLRIQGLPYEVTMADLGAVIRAEKRNVGRNRSWSNWTMYEELEDIEQFLQDTAAAYDYVELKSIGKSTENRDLWVIRIDKPNEAGADKQSVFFDFNLHAREWVTSAVGTWFINEMLTNPDYDSILQAWDFHIAPVLNPDGFAYSKTNERLWRKTRKDHDSIFGCIGADPNRNWDYDFGGPGTSTDKCSDIYHGPYAFSEPETMFASEYVADFGPDFFKMFFSVHSYSQFILLPFGNTAVPPPDYEEMKALGEKAEAVIEGIYGTQYLTDTIPNILYPAAGGSIDWAKGVNGIKWSYAFELRDEGEYGFLLPAEQIIPCAYETWLGIIESLNNVP